MERANKDKQSYGHTGKPVEACINYELDYCHKHNFFPCFFSSTNTDKSRLSIGGEWGPKWMSKVGPNSKVPWLSS